MYDIIHIFRLLPNWTYWTLRAREGPSDRVYENETDIISMRFIDGETDGQVIVALLKFQLSIQDVRLALIERRSSSVLLRDLD